jgi:hypothetical protein
MESTPAMVQHLVNSKAQLATNERCWCTSKAGCRAEGQGAGAPAVEQTLLGARARLTAPSRGARFSRPQAALLPQAEAAELCCPGRPLPASRREASRQLPCPCQGLGQGALAGDRGARDRLDSRRSSAGLAAGGQALPRPKRAGTRMRGTGSGPPHRELDIGRSPGGDSERPQTVRQTRIIGRRNSVADRNTFTESEN